VGVSTMKTDSEIKMSGYEILNHNLGMIETERFISLIQRKRFDYTKWRENLFNELTGKEISKRAMELQNTLKKISYCVDFVKGKKWESMQF
jgi:hypothetical protein